MKRPLHVLIIEDSASDAALVEQELRRGGYEVSAERVDTATTMGAALDKAGWDLIISDHRMPQFSSLAALQLYTERGCDMPFIVVSGSIGEELAASAMRAGAHDYIMKDNLTRLVPAVERELRETEMRRQRRQTEQALTESRRRTELILEAAGEGICGLDTEGIITFINPPGAKLIGWKAEEVIGKSLHEVVHYAKPDGTKFPKQECSLCATLRDGLVHWMDDEVFCRKDKSRFPVAYICTPMREHDKVVGVVLTFQDISKRRTAEMALQESNRRLKQALTELQQSQQQIIQQERLRALGQMAGGVAHDFNDALAKILGFTDLLLTSPEKLNNTGTVQEYLQTIRTAARDAEHVVRRLHEFYRPRREMEIFRPVDLNGVIRQAVALTEPRWKQQARADGRQIEIQTDLESTDLIDGNEADLREVFTNLVFNAVDAMPQGGTITIRTRADGDHIVLEVGDTGTGMTAEVRQHCLEPFFSTKGESGTGLGLAIVFGIVQRHSGTIDIRSEPRNGTTFIIRLPVYTGQREQPAQPKPDQPSRPLHVLVVEDEPLIRDIESEYLTCDGYSVETAANGRTGLEKFRAGRFDLVLSDLAMPEMNGDQLATAIREIAPDTPIIMVTGFGDALEANGVKPTNRDKFLAKPFTHEDLRQAVAEATTQTYEQGEAMTVATCVDLHEIRQTERNHS
jgi:PAS domain S-box-containing protein